MKILFFLLLIIGLTVGLIITQWGLPSGLAYCESMIRLDYAAQSSGQIRYLHLPDFAPVATCGDICTIDKCDNCPPQEWTCNQ